MSQADQITCECEIEEREDGIYARPDASLNPDGKWFGPYATREEANEAVINCLENEMKKMVLEGLGL